jgi:D-beta-D-heptose 7-phosphate kinase / D-beta-D-heptose 1-phosphate adenosyltransferase
MTGSAGVRYSSDAVARRFEEGTVYVITSRRLAEIRTLAEGLAMTVVGDLMLDEFLSGTVERVSPEAPVPVLTYRSNRYVLGGAGNAARTLASLGAHVRLAGLVGDDEAGALLIAEAEALGLDAGGVVVEPRRTTALKTRVIAHAQQIVRIDREATGIVGVAARRRLKEASLAALDGAGALLVSDYDKGTVQAGLARELVAACVAVGTPCVVDSKALHTAYRGATILTPNVGELARLARMHALPDKDVARAAAAVLRRYGPEALLVTRSEAGMSLFAPGEERHDVPALATEVRDVTGAGDTVAAVVALGLALGLPAVEAANLATLAAAVVVRKAGTAAPSWDEMSSLAEG